MADSIIYVAKTKPGGVDGRDHTDRGDKIVAATLRREDMPSRYEVAGWYTIKPEVADLFAVAVSALRKLDPIELLALKDHFPDALARLSK